MPIQYKMKILPAMKAAGYNSNRLRKEKMLSQATIQKLRQGELVSWLNISRICSILKCQPGDILEYVEDREEGENIGNR